MLEYDWPPTVVRREFFVKRRHFIYLFFQWHVGMFFCRFKKQSMKAAYYISMYVRFFIPPTHQSRKSGHAPAGNPVIYCTLEIYTHIHTYSHIFLVTIKTTSSPHGFLFIFIFWSLAWLQKHASFKHKTTQSNHYSLYSSKQHKVIQGHDELVLTGSGSWPLLPLLRCNNNSNNHSNNNRRYKNSMFVLSFFSLLIWQTQHMYRQITRQQWQNIISECQSQSLRKF